MDDYTLPFFRFEHLPEKLRAVSEPFCILATWVNQHVPNNLERSVAMRKLLEAKDAAVRAVLWKDVNADGEHLD